MARKNPNQAAAKPAETKTPEASVPAAPAPEPEAKAEVPEAPAAKALGDNQPKTKAKRVVLTGQVKNGGKMWPKGHDVTGTGLAELGLKNGFAVEVDA